MNEHTLPKILVALGLFMFLQMIVFWNRLAKMDDSKMSLEAEVSMLTRKRDNLHQKINDLHREEHRMELKLDKLDLQIRDLLPLTKNRLNMPTIFFVTPTKRRPAQKADLVRLHQTLSYVPNLFWVLVEDADQPSPAIDEILARSRLKSVHLVALTPEDKRFGDDDPNWKIARGVNQRNAALQWIRSNFGALQKGAVYFGDDDNAYDWKLFENIRSINQIGVWPVGLVGGLLAETPILGSDNQVIGFNSKWKPERPFPIDMAAFAVNVSLINKNPDARFSYDAMRGYQESSFLTGLNLKRSDLEPKAALCSKILVWHTRTEKAKLHKLERLKYSNFSILNELEKDVIV